MRVKEALIVVLVILGAVSVAVGSGCSLRLDGSSYLSVDRFVGGDIPESIVTYDDSLTFEAWIRPSSSNIHDSGVIMQSGKIYSTPARSYTISYNYTLSSIVVRVCEYSKFDDLVPSVVYAITSHVRAHKDMWTHVSYSTYDQQITIGPKKSSYIITKEPLTDSSWYFAVGINFTGAIDNVRVWNTSMSLDALTTLSVNGTCPNSGIDMSTLILFLSFDDCGLNATADASQSHACGHVPAATKRRWGRVETKSQYTYNEYRLRSNTLLHSIPFTLAQSSYAAPNTTAKAIARHARRNRFGRSTVIPPTYSSSTPTEANTCEVIPDTAVQCPYQASKPAPTNSPTQRPSSRPSPTYDPTNSPIPTAGPSPYDSSSGADGSDDFSDASSQDDSSDDTSNTTASTTSTSTTSTTTGSSTSFYGTLVELSEIPMFNMFCLFGIFVIVFASYKLIRRIMKVLKQKKAKESLLTPEDSELEDLDTYYPVQQPATQTQPQSPTPSTNSSVKPKNKYFMYYMPQTQLPRVPGFYAPSKSQIPDNE
jgi:hypothetical protein